MSRSNDKRGQSVSKRTSWSARVLAGVLILLIVVIEIINFSVYRTTERSSERIQSSSTWLTNLATLQRHGFTWSSLYNHLDRTDIWDDIHNRRDDFADMQQRLIADPATEGEVRNDLLAIQFLLPDIDRLDNVLEHSPNPQANENLPILRDEMDQLGLRTNRLFDREQDRYLAETAAITSANKIAQRNLLLASGTSGLMGLALLVMFWRQARSDLRRAYDVVVNEVRERETAEQALRESETRYRSVLANVNEVVFECDRHGNLSFLTPGWQDITDMPIDECIGRHLSEFVRPDEHDRVVAHLNQVANTDIAARVNERLQRFETTFLSGSGDTKRIEVRCNLVPETDGKPALILGTLHDVSDRHRLEIQLRQAQKLESVGSLAAGIAHEINTPIQFISDNLTFLGQAFTAFTDVPVESSSGNVETSSTADAEDLEFLRAEVPEAIEQASEGVRRVITIVSAMKSFGHPDGVTSQHSDLNKAINTTVVVGRSEYRDVADVEFDLGEIPLVRCHVGELNQVFLNLIVNAAHAIGDVSSASGERGKITIRSRHEGEEVVIEFSDTGCGMRPEVAERIFDPFFTTKAVGKGTGQGLSLARSIIVERHQGSINVSSEVGKGTTFSIRLPVEGIPESDPA